METRLEQAVFAGSWTPSKISWNSSYCSSLFKTKLKKKKKQNTKSGILESNGDEEY